MVARRQHLLCRDGSFLKRRGTLLPLLNERCAPITAPQALSARLFVIARSNGIGGWRSCPFASLRRLSGGLTKLPRNITTAGLVEREHLCSCARARARALVRSPDRLNLAHRDSGLYIRVRGVCLLRNCECGGRKPNTSDAAIREHTDRAVAASRDAHLVGGGVNPASLLPGQQWIEG